MERPLAVQWIWQKLGVSRHIERIVQAVLILHSGYIPEKHQANQNCSNQTQNSHLKQ